MARKSNKRRVYELVNSDVLSCSFCLRFAAYRRGFGRGVRYACTACAVERWGVADMAFVDGAEVVDGA